MHWYLNDLSLWPGDLPLRYAEVVEYETLTQPARTGIVIDVAPSDGETPESRVAVEFFDDGDVWVLPVSAVRSTGRLDLERAGPWVYPTLADGSIVKVSVNGSDPVLAQTLGLWCTDRRRGMQGYRVRKIGTKDVIFASFNDLQMP